MVSRDPTGEGQFISSCPLSCPSHTPQPPDSSTLSVTCFHPILHIISTFHHPQVRSRRHDPGMPSPHIPPPLNAKSCTKSYLFTRIPHTSPPHPTQPHPTHQVLLFAILAIELKRKAPKAHTFPEIIKARYGKPAHITFLCFGLITNMIVTAMLLLGGAAVANNLTGMNIYAACFLIPLGTIIYVVFGGLRATFLTDYIHTVVLYLLIIIFGFKVFSMYEGSLIGYVRHSSGCEEAVW